jgi:demethylmenaquinone methyltransferase/2-methoxy-6-polyprenyl-1,4-benzoquinol methylase
MVNIALRQGDVEHLDFEDGSFDRVSVAFGIRNFEHLERGLSEMCRVLRPGGKLVILELSYPDNPFILWCYKLYALHFLPFVGGLVSGHKEAYRYLPKSILAFPKEEVIVPMLRSVGFQNVEVHKFTFGACVMYVAGK